MSDIKVGDTVSLRVIEVSENHLLVGGFGEMDRDAGAGWVFKRHAKPLAEINSVPPERRPPTPMSAIDSKKEAALTWARKWAKVAQGRTTITTSDFSGQLFMAVKELELAERPSDPLAKLLTTLETEAKKMGDSDFVTDRRCATMIRHAIGEYWSTKR